MLKIGDMILLEPKNSDTNEKYKCKLVEREGNNFYVDYPISLKTNRTVFLLDGSQLRGTFVGQDRSVYLFESEVKGRIKQNIPMMILSYPGNENLVKIQRRQYVRIETAVDAAIHPENFEFPPFTAVTDDISAGGAAILTSKHVNLRSGMMIDAWFAFVMENGDYQYRKWKSRVVRTAEMSDSQNKVSIQFLDISARDRQLLLRYCFERQLSLKKKGLNE